MTAGPRWRQTWRLAVGLALLAGIVAPLATAATAQAENATNRFGAEGGDIQSAPLASQNGLSHGIGAVDGRFFGADDGVLAPGGGYLWNPNTLQLGARLPVEIDQPSDGATPSTDEGIQSGQRTIVIAVLAAALLAVAVGSKLARRTGRSGLLQISAGAVGATRLSSSTSRRGNSNPALPVGRLLIVAGVLVGGFWAFLPFDASVVSEVVTCRGAMLSLIGDGAITAPDYPVAHDTCGDVATGRLGQAVTAAAGFGIIAAFLIATRASIGGSASRLIVVLGLGISALGLLGSAWLLTSSADFEHVAPNSANQPVATDIDCGTAMFDFVSPSPTSLDGVDCKLGASGPTTSAILMIACSLVFAFSTFGALGTDDF